MRTQACEKYREMVSASLDGFLLENEEKSLCSHLEACPDCKEYYDETKELLKILKEEPDISMPETLLFDVKERLDRESKALNKCKILPFRKFTLVAAGICLAVLLTQNSGTFQTFFSKDSSMISGSGEAAPQSAATENQPTEAMLSAAPQGAVADATGGQADSAGVGYSAVLPTMTSEAENAMLKNSGIIDIEKPQILSGEDAQNYIIKGKVTLPKVEQSIEASRSAPRTEGEQTSDDPAVSSESASETAAEKPQSFMANVPLPEILHLSEVKIETNSEKTKELLLTFPYEIYVKDNGDIVYLLENSDYNKFLNRLEEEGIGLDSNSYKELSPEQTPVAIVLIQRVR